MWPWRLKMLSSHNFSLLMLNWIVRFVIVVTWICLKSLSKLLHITLALCQKKADFEPDPSLKPDNSHIFPHTNFNRLPLLEKKMSESSDLTHLIWWQQVERWKFSAKQDVFCRHSISQLRLCTWPQSCDIVDGNFLISWDFGYSCYKPQDKTKIV